jgi:hypothetical protein
MSLRGISTQESFVFKIIRQSPDGRTAAPARGKGVAVIMAENCGTKWFLALKDESFFSRCTLS